MPELELNACMASVAFQSRRAGPSSQNTRHNRSGRKSDPRILRLYAWSARQDRRQVERRDEAVCPIRTRHRSASSNANDYTRDRELTPLTEFYQSKRTKRMVSSVVATQARHVRPKPTPTPTPTPIEACFEDVERPK
jgi:hypothetical protein